MQSLRMIDIFSSIGVGSHEMQFQAETTSNHSLDGHISARKSWRDRPRVIRNDSLDSRIKPRA